MVGRKLPLSSQQATLQPLRTSTPLSSFCQILRSAQNILQQLPPPPPPPPPPSPPAPHHSHSPSFLQSILANSVTPVRHCLQHELCRLGGCSRGRGEEGQPQAKAPYHRLPHHPRQLAQARQLAQCLLHHWNPPHGMHCCYLDPIKAPNRALGRSLLLLHRFWYVSLFTICSISSSRHLHLVQALLRDITVCGHTRVTQLLALWSCSSPSVAVELLRDPSDGGAVTIVLITVIPTLPRTPTASARDSCTLTLAGCS